MEKRESLSRLNFLLRTEFKFNFTMIMLMIAFTLFAFKGTKIRELCFCAVVASTLGDLALMNYNRIPSQLFKGKHFYMGMIFFAIAHIFYHFTFASIMGSLVLNTLNTGSYIILVIFIFMMPMIAFLLSEKNVIFKYAALVYTMCILFGALAIFSCMFEFGGRYIFSGIGIVLFIISDILIMVREFFKDTELIRKLIWIFYPIGQLLIIFSV